jgi:hypothetical protein
LKSAIQVHQDYVMAETLTVDLQFAPPPGEAHAMEDDFDGETLKVGLMKA